MIDLTAGGIFCAMFGPESKIIMDAINRVKTFCAYAPRFGNYWRDRYYEALKELTGFESVVTFCDGSTAVEAFWRIMRVYTGKPGVWGGLVDPDEAGVGDLKPKADQFHGWTLGALIMSGRMSWGELGYYPELGEKRFGLVPGDNRTACMIMEPYHAPSGQFHKVEPTINRVKIMQKEFPEIALCIDEIQGGFGRTGKLFAHEWYDRLKPDFVTIGKLAFGGFPGSALLGPKEIMESESVKEFGQLHSTHSGHPVICSVGLAVIEEMQQQNLIERSRELGERMHEALATFPVKSHGKGLMAGLVFQDEKEAKKVIERCDERGVFCVDTGRKWVKIGPALTIEEKDLIDGLLIVKEVVEEVVNERQTEARGDNVEGSEGVDQVLQPVRVLEAETKAGQGDMDGGAVGDHQTGERPTPTD